MRISQVSLTVTTLCYNKHCGHYLWIVIRIMSSLLAVSDRRVRVCSWTVYQRHLKSTRQCHQASFKARSVLGL